MVLAIVCLLAWEVVSVNGLIAPVLSYHNDETLEGLAKHVVDLEAVVQKQSSLIQNITRQLAVLAKHTDTGISFTAFLSTSRTCASTSTLKFDDVKNNNGGGYNQYSGVFRAPVSGMYMFSLALESESAGATDYSVKKQGQIMTYLTVAQTYIGASETSVFHVDAGDDISVECLVASGSQTLRGGRFSYFSGYLLRAD
ncbi:complement C1q-like protein 2 [Haliotis asinina]|uniref:complement C1q-like protein 2 n=1 Tax=Haliotis asinina TaxID=109174 RepID=UPI0035319F7E